MGDGDRDRLEEERAAWPRSLSEELDWLQRRRTLLLRSIAEMQHHQNFPNLSPELLPDVGEMLAWAQDELARVDARIAELSALRRLQSDAPPDSDPASEA
jgi:hypothetical protein